MSDQDNGHISILQRPTTNDPKAWKAYWAEKGQPWRTEPEIDVDRQKYLTERRAIVPNIEKGIYPFKDVKLSRADIEWLLATHENGRGPVDWNDKSQSERQGIDLRAADLQEADLHQLPFACLRGGLDQEEWNSANQEQRQIAGALMNRANLRDAHLEGADLRWAQLDGASLVKAQLVSANLVRVQLERANLYMAQLQEADLRWAQLQGASLVQAQLQRASLRWAHLEGSNLADVSLSDKNHIGPQVDNTHWSNTNLAVVDRSEIEMLGMEEAFSPA